VAENHSIYYDQAYQPLATIHKVDSIAACCAECRKFNDHNSTGAGAVGTSGAAAICHVWTFCSPGGSCTLPGDVPNPPQWTVMTAGDCVLLSAWYLPTGQDVSPGYWGQDRRKNLESLAYWTGAQPGLLQPDKLPDGPRPLACAWSCAESMG